MGAGDLSYEVASSAARQPCVQLSCLLQFHLGEHQTPIGALRALLAGVKGLELEDYSLQVRAVVANLFLADVAASEQYFFDYV